MGGEDIWALPIGEEGEEPFAVLSSPFREIHADLSPDGRWLAYASDEAGEAEVFVMSWPDLRGKWKISTAGGSMPRWRQDGREMYFMAPDRAIMSVEVRTDPDNFVIGEPRQIVQTRVDRPFSIRTHQYVVTGDGEKFLVIEPPQSADDDDVLITLIANPLAG